jgi:hypothetical protein
MEDNKGGTKVVEKWMSPTVLCVDFKLRIVLNLRLTWRKFVTNTILSLLNSRTRGLSVL